MEVSVLRLGWLFRVVPVCRERTRPLHPCIHHRSGSGKGPWLWQGSCLQWKQSCTTVCKLYSRKVGITSYTLRRDLGGKRRVRCSIISEDVRVKHKGWGQSPGEGIGNQHQSQGVRQPLGGGLGSMKEPSLPLALWLLVQGQQDSFQTHWSVQSPVNYCLKHDRLCPGQGPWQLLLARGNGKGQHSVVL